MTLWVCGWRCRPTSRSCCCVTPSPIASCRSGSAQWRPPPIAFAQQGVQPERPLTHDLLRDVLTALGRRLERVDIVDLRDGIFFAELVFDNGVAVSARPSDAIALALRTGSPLFAAEHVLDEAAIEMPAEEDEDGEEVGDEAEVEAFREFLDHVTPEDFEGGSAQ